jgi:hypothetical protein
MDDFLERTYECVAASQTQQVLGAAGAKGDVILRLIIVPETTGAGTVTILDGAGLSGALNKNVFVSGTLSDLRPIIIELGARSKIGAWSITTGANVHVIAVGKFS